MSNVVHLLEYLDCDIKCVSIYCDKIKYREMNVIYYYGIDDGKHIDFSYKMNGHQCKATWNYKQVTCLDCKIRSVLEE